MTQIQAIPTKYQGVLFRSRLEARWAIFFDLLSLPWKYEPEAYQIGKGRYLPDFLVKSEIIEIKPVQGDYHETCADLAALSKMFDCQASLFCGSPSKCHSRSWISGEPNLHLLLSLGPTGGALVQVRSPEGETLWLDSSEAVDYERAGLCERLSTPWMKGIGGDHFCEYGGDDPFDIGRIPAFSEFIGKRSSVRHFDIQWELVCALQQHAAEFADGFRFW